MKNIDISVVKELQSGKIYWVQVKSNSREVMQQAYDQIVKAATKNGFAFVLTNEGVNFIDAPEGYEIKKIK